MQTKPKRQLKKIEDYGNHYCCRTWCGNCGEKAYYYIPKGVPRKDCAPIVCGNCGCDIEVSK